MNRITKDQDLSLNRHSSSVIIFLYYDGNYAMKYENLTRGQADELLLKWNSSEYPGWMAVEQ